MGVIFYLNEGRLDLSMLDEDIDENLVRNIISEVGIVGQDTLDQEEGYIVIPEEVQPILEESPQEEAQENNAVDKCVVSTKTQIEDLMLEIGTTFTGDEISATLEAMAAMFEEDELRQGGGY